MFKVGQRVVFIKGTYVGVEGVVVDVDKGDPDLPYSVAFEDEYEEETRGWFSDKAVEAAEEAD
jgi:transcription antitermination factor NusG